MGAATEEGSKGRGILTVRNEAVLAIQHFQIRLFIYFTRLRPRGTRPVNPLNPPCLDQTRFGYCTNRSPQDAAHFGSSNPDPGIEHELVARVELKS